MRTAFPRAFIALVPVAVISTSCNNLKDYRYATFDPAMNVGPSVESPPVIHTASIPDNLPPAVPYASIQGDFASATWEHLRVLDLRDKAFEYGFDPDFFIYVPQGSNYAGSSSQYLGFGAAVSTPTYRPQAIMHCMRLLPATIGTKSNPDNMITWVSDTTRSESGIQEGDTLISVNGHPVTRSGQGTAPAESELLRLRPGDDVTLVWIRPGTGRMEGTAQAREPDPMPEGIDSMLDDVERNEIKRFQDEAED